MVQNFRFSFLFYRCNAWEHHLCTQFILKQNTNEATCCLQLQLSIFSLPLGLDTSFQSQSILTLIVQGTVSKCLVHS